MAAKTRVAAVVEANGLAHPEGPANVAGGGLVFVETFREQVSLWQPGKGVSQFAFCGGGPNACCVGSDAVYITQIGERVGTWRSGHPRTPSIEKIRDGAVTAVATAVDGQALMAPNDLCFDARGRLCFTDPGEFNPGHPADGFVFCINADGGCHYAVNVGPVFPNGIVALADDSIVWVESYTRRAMRREANGKITEVGTLPKGHMPDGLKVGADGRLYIASIMSGCIDVLDLRTGDQTALEIGGQPLNCVFRGESLFVTDGGPIAHDDPAVDTAEAGRLVRVDVGVRGAEQYSGRIDAAG